MVKVSIEVRAGTARFNVAVRARSAHRAVSLAQRLCPGGDARVMCPVDFGRSLFKDPGVRAGVVGFEPAERMAA